MARNATVLALVLALAGCATGVKPAGFDAAHRAATINESTPSGRHYRAVVAERIYHQLVQSGLRCLIDSPHDREAPVTMLFRIDSAGRPAESMLWPRTRFGLCAFGGIGDFTLAPPPRNDYWVQVTLRP